MKHEHIPFLMNISCLYICLGLLVSLQPAFYSSEAEFKGATPSQYGLVFGIANISLFIFSPLFGKYGEKMGAKLCFILGAVLQGFSGLLFAILPYFEHVAPFLGLSYFLRFIEGLGTAMAWNSVLGILLQIFPNKEASVMSGTQISFGIGYMIGPALGAYLFGMGGFSLPFLVIGPINIIVSILLLLTLPKKQGNDLEISEGKKDGAKERLIETNVRPASVQTGKNCITMYETSIIDLPSMSQNQSGSINLPSNATETTRINVDQCLQKGLKKTTQTNIELRFYDFVTQPQLLLPFLDLFYALCGVGMLESMLGPHLKSNKASTSDIGISFFILGGSHFIGCLIFGHLIDQFGKPLLFSIVGNLLFFTVFVFVGPIPFIRFAKTTKITKGMMVLA